MDDQPLTEITECQRCGKVCETIVRWNPGDYRTQPIISRCCGAPVQVSSMPRPKGKETGG